MAAVMTMCAALAVFAGGLVGVGIFAVIAVIGALAKFTPVGDNLIIGFVVISAIVVGVMAVGGAGYSLTGGGGHTAAPAAAPAGE
ncbi:MAG: hypothetical protein DRJ42_12785 [Deltaproteobacteria bacterium]|nr:MAG: hypothetical protein DRJ42_12785 [Deltaproteobacteria bacterium]